MSERSVGDLFRRASDYATRYRDSVPGRPQRPLISYRESLEGFREALPEKGSAGLVVVDDLATLAEPGLHTMTGPRFFGWVVGGSHELGRAKICAKTHVSHEKHLQRTISCPLWANLRQSTHRLFSEGFSVALPHRAPRGDDGVCCDGAGPIVGQPGNY